MDKKQVYARIARLYDLLDLPFERGRYAPMRPLLWQGLHGRLLDAGVGTGRNLPFYPPGAQVTGIDLSPAMLARARKRRDDLGVTADLREMNILALDFPDGHFDAAVSTFVFCVLDHDQQLPALRELKRVVKPDGEIRILHYSYSAEPRRRFVQRLWAPWVRWAYGASFDCETEQYVEPAGLIIAREIHLFADVIKLLVLKRG